MNSVSVTGKKWLLKEYNSEQVIKLKNDFFLNEITAKLIAIKKIRNEDVENYLNPAIKNLLPNPEILKDMSKATNRALQAIIKKEKIGIFGDYDVDGATSTALLGKYFKELDLPYEIYIPDRKNEGYGPNIKSFEKLIHNGVKIIFTVDCGTLSFDAIDYAKNRNVEFGWTLKIVPRVGHDNRLIAPYARDFLFHEKYYL